MRIQREEREQRREEQALRRMDRKVEGVAIDTRVLPRQNVIEHSDEISELNAEDYLEMPEVREEKDCAFTSDGGYPPAENLTPSAFSDEALAAVTPEASQNISAWTPETETAQGASWNTAPAEASWDVATEPEDPWSTTASQEQKDPWSSAAEPEDPWSTASAQEQKESWGSAAGPEKRMGGGCAESTAERAAGSIGSRIARRDKGCVRHRGKCRTYHICTCGIR